MTKPNSPIINISTLLSETQYLQSKLPLIQGLTKGKQGGREGVAELYDLLIPCLIAHNHLYNNAKPIITDTEYDQLFDALKQIESLHPELICDDSPTQKIVGQYEVQTEFKKSNHSSPILSLQNTYNAEEIMDRYESIHKMLQKKIEEIEDTQQQEYLQLKTQNLQLLIQPKYDGLSIVLTYTDGKLTKAVTRGDGYTGDDVTENVKTIKNIPLSLPTFNTGEGASLPVKGGAHRAEGLSTKEESTPLRGGQGGKTTLRGEVLMPKSVRKKINTERETNGEEPFANTRNAAAGSLKLLDTNEVAKRGLVCYIYDVLSEQEHEKTLLISPPSEGGGGKPEGKKEQEDEIKQESKIETLLSHFPQYSTPPQRTNIGIQEVIDLISNPQTKEELFKADIDFDGLVIKIVDPTIRELLGSTNHHPRRAIAYKFPAQQIATQIERIERQVGRTGILTPVAHLTPKELSGVTISRVSLHNRDFIQSKDIQVQDRVWLQRSGEVIPYIVAVITDRRTGNEKKISSDSILCPVCGSHAIKLENEVGTKSNPEISTQFFCPDKQCPGILKEQLKHFVSKNCMNIASIGEGMIDLFVDHGLIHSLADLYTLTQSDQIFLLKRFPGIASKKIDTLVDELEKSKSNELRRFLNALGIPGIGIKLAKEIISHFEKEGLRSESKSLIKVFQTISSPDMLGSIHGIGETLTQELGQRSNNPINIQLLTQFEQHGISPVTHNSQPVTGNSICITGTFPLSRSELEFYITQAGYTFSPTLTRTTDYLFVGDNAGSKKDKIGPNTTTISDWTQICTMLDISIPLFPTSFESPSLGGRCETSTLGVKVPEGRKGNSEGNSTGTMQSLFS